MQRQKTAHDALFPGYLLLLPVTQGVDTVCQDDQILAFAVPAALNDAHQAHTYPWPVFTARVMGEKYAMLSRFFAGQDERGMAFLYRMTELLRQAENDKLNLARYAYLLARLQPKRSSGSYALYNEFSKQMYAWACSGTDRLQLVTAIYLYVYMNRKAD